MPIRVALIADFREENWPSMDLTADLLFDQLSRRRGYAIQAELVRPTFRRLSSPGTTPVRHFRNLDRGLNRYCYYPAFLSKMVDRFELFHIVDHSYAHLVRVLPAERTVVTCHDVDAFRCLFHEKLRAKNWILRVIARRVLSGLQRAAAIACNSAHTRDQLLDLRIADDSRLRIIPIGAHPALLPQADHAADARIESALGPARPQHFDLLHVGSTVKRKRIPFLLRILAHTARQIANVRLIRVGGAFTPEQTRFASELGVADRIVTLPFLDYRDLAAVYRRASLTLLPSETEGLGLPVIESLSCGTPVVLSDIPIMHETGGDAALFCSVDDPQAWAFTISAMLLQNSHSRDVYRDKALRWASRFTAEAYATRTAALYAEVLGRSKEACRRNYGLNTSNLTNA